MPVADTIIDTFPSFLTAVQASQPDTVEEWLNCWVEHYMTGWPTLYEMVTSDYEEQGDDWRQVAQEMVFPGMNDKLPAIRNAYRHLIQVIVPTEQRVRDSLNYSGEVCYVLYVGLGNGAGWATKYDNRPAVLFGLEGIVDSGFDPLDRLPGLVAHELGHVAHHSWREMHSLGLGSGPWWQLYEEGFAQTCEAEAQAGSDWHMNVSDSGGDWLTWCDANRSWLAAEFLRTVDRGDSIRPFFGSWYELRGHKQTGYYLGQQVIGALMDDMTLREIALLESGRGLERTLRAVLNDFAAVKQ